MTLEYWTFRICWSFIFLSHFLNFVIFLWENRFFVAITSLSAHGKIYSLQRGKLTSLAVRSADRNLARSTGASNDHDVSDAVLLGGFNLASRSDGAEGNRFIAFFSPTVYRLVSIKKSSNDHSDLIRVVCLSMFRLCPSHIRLL